MAQNKKTLAAILASLILFALILSSFPQVHAQTPDNPIPLANLGNATGGILNPEGINTEQINKTAQEYKSKAEQRIEAINLWLDNNAKWFKTILGAVPEVSWYFAFVLYCFIWGFVTFVLNAKKNFYLGFNSGKIAGISTGTIIGIAAFVILFIALKAHIYLAKLVFTTISWGNDVWYFKLLKIAIIIAVTIVIYLFLKAWGKQREEKAKKDREETQETDQKALRVLVKGATGRG